MQDGSIGGGGGGARGKERKDNEQQVQEQLQVQEQEQKERKQQSGKCIVVTDDVFLRQRVIQAGGLVMTFQQLWDLLYSMDRME